MLYFVKVEGANLSVRYDSTEQAKAAAAELKLLKRVTGLYMKRLKKTIKEHDQAEKERRKRRKGGILARIIRRIINGRAIAVAPVDEELEQLSVMGELLDNIELEICAAESYIIRKRMGG